MASGSTYHYVLTTSASLGRGTVMNSWVAGVYTTRPGQTRDEVFAALMAQARDHAGVDNVTPIFFSLEPNALVG